MKLKEIFIIFCMSVLVLAPSLGNAEKKKPFKFERAGPYAINVDYSKKLAEMIEAGNYRANGAVSDENFTVYGSGKVELEVEIIHFDKKIETSEVLEELAKHELTPAYIEHLLAFGAQHPDKQEKRPSRPIQCAEKTDERKKDEIDRVERQYSDERKRDQHDAGEHIEQHQQELVHTPSEWHANIRKHRLFHSG